MKKEHQEHQTHHKNTSDEEAQKDLSIQASLNDIFLNLGIIAVLKDLILEYLKLKPGTYHLPSVILYQYVPTADSNAVRVKLRSPGTNGPRDANLQMNNFFKSISGGAEYTQLSEHFFRTTGTTEIPVTLNGINLSITTSLYHTTHWIGQGNKWSSKDVDYKPEDNVVFFFGPYYLIKSLLNCYDENSRNQKPPRQLFGWIIDCPYDIAAFERTRYSDISKIPNDDAPTKKEDPTKKDQIRDISQDTLNHIAFFFTNLAKDINKQLKPAFLSKLKAILLKDLEEYFNNNQLSIAHHHKKRAQSLHAALCSAKLEEILPTLKYQLNLFDKVAEPKSKGVAAEKKAKHEQPLKNNTKDDYYDTISHYHKKFNQYSVEDKIVEDTGIIPTLR